jgi:hypothetical protein
MKTRKKEKKSIKTVTLRDIEKMLEKYCRSKGYVGFQLRLIPLEL